MRRIELSDAPPSSQAAVKSVQKKRNAVQAGFRQSPQNPSQALPGSSQNIAQESAEEVPDEDVPEELFCSLKTSVVGIQYYKGSLFYCS